MPPLGIAPLTTWRAAATAAYYLIEPRSYVFLAICDMKAHDPGKNMGAYCHEPCSGFAFLFLFFACFLCLARKICNGTKLPCSFSSSIVTVFTAPRRKIHLQSCRRNRVLLATKKTQERSEGERNKPEVLGGVDVKVDAPWQAKYPNGQTLQGWWRSGSSSLY